MAAANFGAARKEARTISEINVTPLVDIMLVLLVVFMVTAAHIVRQSLQVRLPEAATAEPSTVTLLSLSIAADGGVRLAGQATDETSIRAFIRQHFAKGQRLEAVIAADKAAHHGDVVRVIDLVRQEGVERFAINVLKSEETVP